MSAAVAAWPLALPRTEAYRAAHCAANETELEINPAKPTSIIPPINTAKDSNTSVDSISVLPRRAARFAAPRRCPVVDVLIRQPPSLHAHADLGGGGARESQPGVIENGRRGRLRVHLHVDQHVARATPRAAHRDSGGTLARPH